MNNLLRILAHYQQSDYSFLPVRDHIMEYLRSARYIEELQKLLEDDQYRLSVRLEPPTPPGSTTKDSTTNDVKSTTINHHLSPSRKSGGSIRKPPDGSVKFVPGHTKSRSLGTKWVFIFTNFLILNCRSSVIWLFSAYVYMLTCVTSTNGKIRLRSASLPRSAFRQPWSTAPAATDPSWVAIFKQTASTKHKTWHNQICQ